MLENRNVLQKHEFLKTKAKKTKLMADLIAKYGKQITSKFNNA